MPIRKLSQADADALRDAHEELMAIGAYEGSSRPPFITRTARAGSRKKVELRTVDQIAEWGGISPARLHELKRSGWRLKLSRTAAAANGDAPVYSRDQFAAMLAYTKDVYEKMLEYERRIADLERHIADLERNTR